MVELIENKEINNTIAIPTYPDDDETPKSGLFTFWGGLTISLPVDLDNEELLINLNHKIFKGNVKIDLINLLNLELIELTDNEESLSQYEDDIRPQLLLYKDLFKEGLKIINQKIDEVDSFISDNS